MISRRGFLKGALGFPLISGVRGAGASEGQGEASRRSVFGGRIFRAFVETVIPGRATDPSGTGGALEAGTLEYLERVENARLFPVSLRVVHLAVTKTLGVYSRLRTLQRFDTLPLRDREKLVAELVRLPGVPLLLRLIRAPFYTGAVNRMGFDLIGYPGPNSGYEDFSFREVLASPEAGSQGGNLP